MAKAIALVRIADLHRIEAAAHEIVRVALISGSGIALIAAGRALPF